MTANELLAKLSEIIAADPAKADVVVELEISDGMEAAEHVAFYANTATGRIGKRVVLEPRIVISSIRKS